MKRQDYHKVEKVWGFEKWIVNNDKYCGKLMFIKKGARSSLHYHPVKHETMYVTQGRMKMELNDEVFELGVGDSVEIKSGDVHRFTGIADTVFFEFSTPHDDEDVMRLEESHGS
jgi:quercetin dioxygenase-like cupin family protein